MVGLMVAWLDDQTAVHLVYLRAASWGTTTANLLVEQMVDCSVDCSVCLMVAWLDDLKAELMVELLDNCSADQLAISWVEWWAFLMAAWLGIEKDCR